MDCNVYIAIMIKSLILMGNVSQGMIVHLTSILIGIAMNANNVIKDVQIVLEVQEIALLVKVNISKV